MGIAQQIIAQRKAQEVIQYFQMGGDNWVGCLSNDVQKYLIREGFAVNELNRCSPEVSVTLTAPHWRN